MEVRSSYTYWYESFCWYCLSFFDRVDKHIRVTNFKVQDYNFDRVGNHTITYNTFYCPSKGLGYPRCSSQRLKLSPDVNN